MEIPKEPIRYPDHNKRKKETIVRWILPLGVSPEIKRMLQTAYANEDASELEWNKSEGFVAISTVVPSFLQN